MAKRQLFRFVEGHITLFLQNSSQKPYIFTNQHWQKVDEKE